MRILLALSVALALLTSSAGPAAADVTVDGPPVLVCVGDLCTPCPEAIVVPTPPEIGVRYSGADC